MNGVALQRNGLAEILSSLPLEDMRWAVEYLTGKIKSAYAIPASIEKSRGWQKHQISPEVMAMTFHKRKNVSGNYKEELTNALEEKYQ